MNLTEAIKTKEAARAGIERIFQETQNQFQQELARLKAEALKLEGAIEALKALNEDK